MARASSKGQKFTEKYGVEATQIYKGPASGDLSMLKIPPKGHVLYDPTAPSSFDELRVQEIDSCGKMTDAIEVWTDPDSGILWVLDGRGRRLDVEEVNRRRARDKREPVQPFIVVFSGNEKEAIARVRTKNYHRRVPTPSGMGMDIYVLRKAGWSWEDVAKKLHVISDDPEQWARKLMPLAFCIPEVRDAVDQKRIPQSAARKFGGSAMDGQNALPRQEQLKLLADMLSAANQTDKPRPRSAGVRARVQEKLADSSNSSAWLVRATLAWVEGDDEALNHWPEVKRLVQIASEPDKAEEKPKKKVDKARKVSRENRAQV